MKLVVLEGPAARPFFEVFQDRTLIGRAPDCDVLVFDAQVSRHHAQILKLGDAYVLESLQQANPAIVNDRVMLTRRRLIDGDLIVLGTVVLEVDIPPETVTPQHVPAEATAGPASSDPATMFAIDERLTPPIEERRTPRPPAMPPLSPREQLRVMANRLGAAGQRLQTRLASPSNLPTVSPVEGAAVARIVADHERLGGDAELARLATLLSDRLTNQTDIRALYTLGAEATALIAWSRLAQRSMDEAVHLAEVLAVH